MNPLVAIIIVWGVMAVILSLVTGVEFETALWVVPLSIVTMLAIIGVIYMILNYLEQPSKEQKAREAEERERERKQRELENSIERKQNIDRLVDAIKTHRHALNRNLERAVITDDYGAVVENNTYKVLDEFYKSVGLGTYFSSDYGIRSKTKKFVFEQLGIWEEYDRESGFDINTIPTDGHEFEHWVADGLNKFGWDAKATSGSGDQGIDVIAKKNGKIIGLQCKLLKSSVGNKAVQEAHAGKAFHQMDVVGVISNASYTKSAKALATDTGVKLLSHHDIPNLYEKMFSE